jgi:hypothetical protein
MGAEKLYDYAMKLGQGNDRTAAERKLLTDRSNALDCALHFIGHMLLYQRGNLELAEIPYELRKHDTLLYIYALRAVRTLSPEKVAVVFRILWADICDIHTSQRHKRDLIDFLLHNIYSYEEYVFLVK